VTCDRWDRTHRAAIGVHEHKGLRSTDIRYVDGIPVLVAEFVILQFAAMRWTSINFIESMIYEARRKRLITADSIEGFLGVKARRGRPGVRKLRAAIELARRHEIPPESNKESLLLQRCREHKLGEPVLQYVLRDDAGRFVGRFDGALLDDRVLLEYQSMEWHQNEDELAKANDRRLAAFGLHWYVIEVRWWDLKTGGRGFAKAVLDHRARPARP
jgi:hypothetical protein